jgi:hypothetical protein
MAGLLGLHRPPAAVEGAHSGHRALVEVVWGERLLHVVAARLIANRHVDVRTKAARTGTAVNAGRLSGLSGTAPRRGAAPHSRTALAASPSRERPAEAQSVSWNKQKSRTRSRTPAAVPVASTCTVGRICARQEVGPGEHLGGVSLDCGLPLLSWARGATAHGINSAASPPPPRHPTTCGRGEGVAICLTPALQLIFLAHSTHPRSLHPIPPGPAPATAAARPLRHSPPGQAGAG